MARSPLLVVVLLLALVVSPALARQFVLIVSKNDLKDAAEAHDTELSEDSPDWEEFRDPDVRPEHELDSGSWRFAVDPPDASPNSTADDPAAALYRSGVRGLLAAASSGDASAVEEAVADIEAAASAGFAHAQSAMGFLHGSGIARAQNRAKAFTYHHFAAQGGDLQSKMAVAYAYFRQEMQEEAVKLYAELAEAAVASFSITKDPQVIDLRIHNGAEENKEALRKFRGEEDGDFQVTEYQANRGNAASMYRIGMFYYFGLRGIKRDHQKALQWFRKAVEKGDTMSMEFLGEIYASGSGVERNYTEAMLWLTRAAKHKFYSAYNGLGYLYVKGYGVEKKNYTKAKEYFQKAADKKEPGGNYNLGVLYLKGIGVKRDIPKACAHFLNAANAGQPKAYYQIAKMFQKGIGLKQNTAMAIMLYKLVAERGPWSSLSRLAVESYLQGDIGKALLLYLRMAELGYEVAQSNAAWILDKYGENSMCMGEFGSCTDQERHLRAHSLWWKASEQGNEHAALLIGDAYYYGRGTERDFERAAEAYMHAKYQSNAQAMFNLGYMHEHGEGLPYDLHLAKRYYDEALEIDEKAKLPVTLALTSLWIRKNYGGSVLVNLIDSLPGIFPKIEEWVEEVIMDEGNVTIFTLFICLLTVLYLRERQRRPVVVHPPQPDDGQQN